MLVIDNLTPFFIKQHKFYLEHITYKSYIKNKIITHSINNLSKLLFSNGKKLFSFIKPRAITFVNETLKDRKFKAEDTVVDKITKFIHDVFNKHKELKQTSKAIIKEIADERNEKIILLVKDNINNTYQQSYFDLIYKKGEKTKVLNKHSRQLLKNYY